MITNLDREELERTYKQAKKDNRALDAKRRRVVIYDNYTLHIREDRIFMVITYLKSWAPAFEQTYSAAL